MKLRITFIITLLLGVFNECIQILLPDRYFDPVDIAFNGLAAGMAIESTEILNWVRIWKNRSKLKRKQ